ncbi:nucleoside triphosphate pyrophosphohydrolase [Ancylobacter sp. WKF20]|uniref:nucleoside triphosphate pyrophosphohydrolase n=1 Tax=Ancylobacter sp. WKF20 TaxID=3039801 RepID=UPI002434312D|nr:nucleoside triphosphate pyrophosphohydrolase [Ancylobacter sp. WKF20]WGD31387.1 nucleoside triphosphate pyrophosphohydrolase [Ancylobacter sp. WKF20]
MTPSRDLQRLIDIMAALRTPGTGCPWDLEQDFASVAPYTIEEAYEVADAIARGDFDDLCDELGDLLLQVVFHARMAEEQGRFDFGDVVTAITAKMIRRHPHVFGDVRGRDTAAVNAAWDQIKAEEKAAKAERQRLRGLDTRREDEGALAGVPVGAPALTRAVKLQTKAAKVGFDWPETRSVLDKIREEIDEVEAEIVAGDRAAAAGEIGDLLFALANLARHLDVDPESALRGTNEKFVRRFGFIEERLAAVGRTPQQATLDEMEALWQEAKGRVPSPAASPARASTPGLPDSDPN